MIEEPHPGADLEQRRTELASAGIRSGVIRNIGPAIEIAATQVRSCPNTGAPTLTTPRSFSSVLTVYPLARILARASRNAARDVIVRGPTRLSPQRGRPRPRPGARRPGGICRTRSCAPGSDARREHAQRRL
ncbi:MAG: hypothetical protein R2705_05835 [Ilumatobacteraceae bacterium]